MNRRITALALTALALFGLTACTGPGVAPSTSESSSSAPGPESGSSGDGQTVSEACALVQQTITDATSEFESAASADPAAVVDAMRNAAESISGAAAQVSNDEVAALLPSLQEMFEKTSEIMQALVDGDVSKLGEMSEIGQSFQETTQTFQELCAG